MKRLLFTAVIVFAAAAAPALAQTGTCPPAGYDRARLEALKASEWAIPSARARNAFARAMIACVASPDTSLRDGALYESMYRLLRTRQLSTETMIAIEADLEARLTAPEGDGFERPFAALVLSEVARADRVEAYLPAAARTRLLDASIAYFAGVRDYRGFDERAGWRHGVAHGADLLLQLSLNPAFGKSELTRILAALSAQVAPEGHFYIYGEPERIARPVIFMAQRGLISEAEWTAWFASLPKVDEAAFSTQAGLARRHNLTALYATIALNVRLTENAEDNALLPGVEAALRALP